MIRELSECKKNLRDVVVVQSAQCQRKPNFILLVDVSYVVDAGVELETLAEEFDVLLNVTSSTHQFGIETTNLETIAKRIFWLNPASRESHIRLAGHSVIFVLEHEWQVRIRGKVFDISGTLKLDDGQEAKLLANALHKRPSRASRALLRETYAFPRLMRMVTI